MLRTNFIFTLILSLCSVASRADVIYGPELVTTPDTASYTFTRNVDITGMPQGYYLYKVYNGTTGPYLAPSCLGLTPAGLVRQCLSNNAVEKLQTDYTQFENYSFKLNGAVIASATIGHLRSYKEVALNFNRDINTFEFTKLGFPTSQLRYSLESTVVANLKPKAFFSVKKLVGSAPMQQQVKAGYSFDPLGRSLTYTWDFGDGTGTASGLSANYTYNSPGTYQITLKVKNSAGQEDQISIPVEVLPPAQNLPTNQTPVIKTNIIRGTPEYIYVDTSGSYDPDGVISSFEFIWGDGTKTTSAWTADHVYSAPGTYIVTVKATDDRGGKSEVERSIVVSPSPYFDSQETIYGPTSFNGSDTQSPVMHTVNFNAPSDKLDELYRIRILNADGEPRPTNDPCNSIFDLLCQFNNWMNSQYVNQYRVNNAYVYVNDLRVTASGDVSKFQYLFEGVVKLKEINKLSVQIWGGSATYLQVIVDRVAPVADTEPPQILATGFPTQPTLTNNPNFHLSLDIRDIASTTTTVQVNGMTAVESKSKKIIQDLHLPEGTNTVFVSSVDASGNSSSIVTDTITVDVTPPVLNSVLPASDETIRSNQRLVMISGFSDEPLSDISANGLSLPLDEGGTSFAGQLLFLTDGTKTIKLVATDLAGNKSTLENNIVIETDFQAPVLTVTGYKPYVNTPSIRLDISAQDIHLPTVSVYVNDNLVFTTFERFISWDVPLDPEIDNYIKIIAVDDWGNESSYQTGPIRMDTQPPVLTMTNPLEGQQLDAAYQVISGTSDKRLSEVFINGESVPNFSADRKSFNMPYTFASEGLQQFYVVGIDEVGNETSLTVSFSVLIRTLYPELVTIVPVQDGTKYLVKGAAGASKPGYSVTLSTGFFSSETKNANFEGAFEFLVDAFSSASLKAQDPLTGKVEIHEIFLGSNSDIILSGSVFDTSGQPLANATVKIVGTDVQTTTDSGGVFVFRRSTTNINSLRGDRTLVVDGSTVTLAEGEEATKRFSQSLVNVTVSVSNDSIIQRPIYLAPTYLDNTGGHVDYQAGGTVTDTHAPGTTLEIPAQSVQFPAGSSDGKISIVEIPVSRTTIPPPAFARPTKVIALEPSGTTFSEPVDVTMPNVGEYPQGTDVAIMLYNSKTGDWEVGGVGTVENGGQSVRTKSGQGIRHFSLAYATVLSPVVKKIGDQDKPGANIADGGVKTSIDAPSFTVLNKTITPSLIYNSSWARPTAAVTNLFDFPLQELEAQTYTETGTDVVKYKIRTRFCSGIFIIPACLDKSPIQTDNDLIKQPYVEALTAIDFTSVTTVRSLIQPDYITAQFHSNDIQTEKFKMVGVPNQAVVSFAVEMKKPGTDDTGFLPTGIYPFNVHYEASFKEQITGTRTVEYRVLGADQNVSAQTEQPMIKADPVNINERRTIENAFDQDVGGPLFVQNEVQSSVGRGWKIAGVQRIVNPNDNHLMIEESNGNVSSYYQKDTIKTIANIGTLGGDLKKGVGLVGYPNVQFAKSDGMKFYQANLSGSSVSAQEFGTASEMKGIVAGNYNYNWTQSDIVDYIYVCDERWEWPGGNICVRDHYEPVIQYTPKSHCEVKKFDYTYGSQPVTFLPLSNGDVVYSDQTRHALIRVSNGTTSLFAGRLGTAGSINPQGLGVASHLANPIPDFNLQNFVMTECNNRTGMNCSYRTQDSTSSENTGNNSCGNLVQGSGVVPVAGWDPYSQVNSSPLNKPTAVIYGPRANTFIVADTGNNQVRLVDFDNNVISTLAGGGGTSDIPVGSTVNATEGGLFHPRAVALDAAGNLFIATEAGHIMKVDGSGQMTVFAGLSQSEGGVLANSVAAEKAFFSMPSGLAVDNAKGYLYVADTGHHRVVRIDFANRAAVVVAGTGAPGDNGDSTPPLSTQLFSPTQLFVTNDGALVVSDSGNNKIRKITFADSANGLAFVPGNKDLSSIVKNEDGSWVRTFRNGFKVHFNDKGYQTQSVDLAGLSVNYSYDTNNRLTQVTYPNGDSVLYQYSGDLLSSIRDPGGRLTLFSYNSKGELSEVEYPDGSRQEYEYNAKGLMSVEGNKKNGAIQYFYNVANRLVKVIKPDNSQIQIADSVSKSLASGTNENPGQLQSRVGATRGVYDGIIDPKGIEIKIDKDLNGFVQVITDASGGKTTFAYNENGKPVSVIRPDTSNAEFEYNSSTGDLVRSYDSATGKEKILGYDTLGNVIAETTNGKTVHRNYSSSTGLLLSTTDIAGASTTVAYNGFELPIQIQKVGANGDSTTETRDYDNKGRLVKVNTDDKETRFSYDAYGNMSLKTLVNGAQLVNEAYEYDLFNRLTSVTNPRAEKTLYTYSLAGELTEVTDPKGKVTSFVYDSLGRLTSKTNPLNYSVTMAYDQNGNLISQTNERNQTITFGYDDLNQMISKVTPEQTYSFTYDIRGNLATVSNSTGTISNTYDVGSRLQTQAFNGASGFSSYATAYTYNSFDQRTSMTDSLGGQVLYGYDSAMRLGQLQNTKGENFYFGYDGVNRLKQVHGVGINKLISYATGNLQSLIYNKTSNSQSVEAITLSHNQLGFVTGSQGVSATESYGYDEAGYVSSVNRTFASLNGSTPLSLPAQESYSYDNLGNRITDLLGAYVYDSTGQLLTDDGRNQYFYDYSGNIMQKVNKSSGQVVKFEHNSENQLVSVAYYANALSANSYKGASYHYDPAGRRIRKQVYDSNSPGNIIKNYTRNYGYDGEEMSVELDASGNLLARYTHSALTTDDVLSVDISSAGVSAGLAQNSGTYEFIKDHVGSVKAVSDSAGNIVQRIHYSAFGEVLGLVSPDNSADLSSAPPLRTHFAYTGREFDEESGLYYYRARYYDAATGRFIQQDPHPGKLSSALSVINKYVYANNNGVNYVDPDGKFAFLAPIIGFLFEAAITSLIPAILFSSLQASLMGGNFWANFGSVFLTNWTQGFLLSVAGGGLGYGIAAALPRFGLGTALAVGNAAVLGLHGGATGGWAGALTGVVAGGIVGFATPAIAVGAKEYGPKISFWLERGVNILLNSVLPTTGDLSPACGLNCNSMKVP
ncbi:MAG: PKD domain-containing protein [Bdellovibrio sp.]|nr:PKD domain-containing protein [Bdellovibrio sp.]